MKTELRVAVTFGMIFLLINLLTAIFFPYPSPYQLLVFRTILALAAAGVGATIPGLLNLKLSSGKIFTIRAAGALGLFATVYFINPPSLVSNAVFNRDSKKLSSAIGEVVNNPSTFVGLPETDKMTKLARIASLAERLSGAPVSLSPQAKVVLMQLRSPKPDSSGHGPFVGISTDDIGELEQSLARQTIGLTRDEEGLANYPGPSNRPHRNASNNR